MKQDLKFLVQKCFEENTKYGQMPETIQEFNQMFSNKEYERVLKDFMIGLCILDEDE